MGITHCLFSLEIQSKEAFKDSETGEGGAPSKLLHHKFMSMRKATLAHNVA